MRALRFGPGLLTDSEPLQSESAFPALVGRIASIKYLVLSAPASSIPTYGKGVHRCESAVRISSDSM